MPRRRTRKTRSRTEGRRQGTSDQRPDRASVPSMTRWKFLANINHTRARARMHTLSSSSSIIEDEDSQTGGS